MFLRLRLRGLYLETGEVSKRVSGYSIRSGKELRGIPSTNITQYREALSAHFSNRNEMFPLKSLHISPPNDARHL